METTRSRDDWKAETMRLRKLRNKDQEDLKEARNSILEQAVLKNDAYVKLHQTRKNFWAVCGIALAAILVTASHILIWIYLRS